MKNMMQRLFLLGAVMHCSQIQGMDLRGALKTSVEDDAREKMVRVFDELLQVRKESVIMIESEDEADDLHRECAALFVRPDDICKEVSGSDDEIMEQLRERALSDINVQGNSSGSSASMNDDDDYRIYPCRPKVPRANSRDDNEKL